MRRQGNIPRRAVILYPRKVLGKLLFILQVRLASDLNPLSLGRGIIEEWGRGTIKMADLTTSMGLPRPEIEERNNCVTVRFRRKDAISVRQSGGGVTEPQQVVLALLHRFDAGLALREIRPLLNEQLSDTQIRRCLAALKAKGLVRATGHGRGARWRVT